MQRISPQRLIRLLRRATAGYIEHESLSRGAAISFYVVTSLAPILLIVVAVAGTVFGQEEVRGGLVNEMRALFGHEGGEFVQSILSHSNASGTDTIATAFGALMVLVTASGVFGEMQAGLNKVWDVDATKQPWSAMVRARAVSVGLIAVLGFLMMVSLAASTALTAFGVFLTSVSTAAPLILALLNALVSLILFTALFAIVFRVLPDTFIPWKDVIEGAFITAVLFTIGKALIGWYLGAVAAGSGYGAAGAVILILLWSYYSVQIFLFGAEITRAVFILREGKNQS